MKFESKQRISSTFRCQLRDLNDAMWFRRLNKKSHNWFGAENLNWFIPQIAFDKEKDTLQLANLKCKKKPRVKRKENWEFQCNIKTTCSVAIVSFFFLFLALSLSRSTLTHKSMHQTTWSKQIYGKHSLTQLETESQSELDFENSAINLYVINCGVSMIWLMCTQAHFTH